MQPILDFLQTIILGTELWRWIVAPLFIGLTMRALDHIQRIFTTRLRQHANTTPNQLDDVLVNVVEHTRLILIFFLVVYLGGLILNLPLPLLSFLGKVALAALLLQAGLWISEILQFGIRMYATRRGETADPTTVTTLAFVGRIVLWGTIALLVLDNSGVEITSLVAGLGITGIAAALAVQNVLSDVFASLSIHLDKPFVIGDFILVDDMQGQVEHIGLKTTRIRSISGEELVFGNNDLLSSRIRNFKKMRERRATFNFAVAYNTSPEKLEAIRGILKAIIDDIENANFQSAHFTGFGPASFQFEASYSVVDPDYDFYMDVQHIINIQMLCRFRDAGIEFAVPTQAIYVAAPSPNGASVAPLPTITQQ